MSYIMKTIQDYAKEFIELSSDWAEGFGLQEFKASNPSPELYFYVKTHGWNNAVDRLMEYV